MYKNINEYFNFQDIIIEVDGDKYVPFVKEGQDLDFYFYIEDTIDDIDVQMTFTNDDRIEERTLNGIWKPVLQVFYSDNDIDFDNKKKSSSDSDYTAIAYSVCDNKLFFQDNKLEETTAIEFAKDHFNMIEVVVAFLKKLRFYPEKNNPFLDKFVTALKSELQPFLSK